LSMCAIFALECCRKEIVFGRFQGNEMNPPSVQRCPFGCPVRKLDGRPQRTKLLFQRFQSDGQCTVLRLWGGRTISAEKAIEGGMV